LLNLFLAKMRTAGNPSSHVKAAKGAGKTTNDGP